ncbi:MAG: ATP-dependent Clp protease ATP-binding subunit [Candidatus Levybacteria bacterium]|nr:ATP-dependent Clp protease ATP-binding subunit [Candidatus Levybacteria bacterium]
MNPALRQNLSALSHLDSRATQVLQHSQQEAARVRQQHIEPEQLLLGLLYDEAIFKLFEDFAVDITKLTQEIQSKEQVGNFMGQPTLSNTTQQIFEQAYRDAKKRGANFVTPEDILVVLFSGNIQTAAFLQEQGVKKEQVMEKLAKSPEYMSGKKSVLNSFGIDLTEEAKQGKLDPVTGRDKEVTRLVHILLRRTKNNPVIIGEAGVGKTAIIEGLAQAIVAGNVPKDLQGKRIIQLDLSSLVAGASHRGEFEERLRSVIKEAMASSGQIILFVDEIHTVMGAGDEGGAMDASNIIKPYLTRGQLQIIGTTTTTEYRKHFEKDKAFERRFQPILCEEPDEKTAMKMLQVLKPKYEQFHKVVITDEAIEAAVKLSKKYIGERYLPDKAVDLLDEAAAEVKLSHGGESAVPKTESQVTSDKSQVGGTDSNPPNNPNPPSPTGNEVRKEDIEQVVSAWTGIPITKLTEDEGQKLLKLEERVHQRLIDQEEAVSAVSEAVRRGRIGLAAANRPIASFIFLGPTGVGKTELAKTLAEILFGRDDAMVRLDMSEYMEKHEVAKLIGAPPGYVGYEEGGQLTEAVRAKPYSIVLMDEVEKAHPDVFNILLQLLEDGRLTDNKGNTISFKNTIVICTSNIGSQVIQQKLSEQDTKAQKTKEEYAKEFSELETIVSDELHKFFRPELLNRFDDTVIFKPLHREHMNEIAKLGIEKTAKLLREQGYILSITDKGVNQLAEEGYDPVYGARPLRRLIQTSIENPIALQLISRKFIPGDTIQIDYDQVKNEFVFNKINKPTVEKTKGSEETHSTSFDKTQDKSSGQANETKGEGQQPQAPGGAGQAPSTGSGQGQQVSQDPNVQQPPLQQPQNPQPPYNPLPIPGQGGMPDPNMVAVQNAQQQAMGMTPQVTDPNGMIQPSFDVSSVIDPQQTPPPPAAGSSTSVSSGFAQALANLKESE